MARINLGKVVPEKGIDYFTDAEVEEIKNEIKVEIDAQGMARDIELLKTDSGHTIEMTLNENYQIVLVLKNAAGTALSTQTIDLPNENAITNLAYNNGVLTITKQSGATSQINLTGLIEGLVTESDFNTFKEALQTTLEAINEKDAEQDEAIAENYKVINKLNEKLENQQKVISQLPQVTGQGTSITLENTIEAQFTKFDVEGNSVQDGTPSPDNEVPIYSAGDNENLFDIDSVTSVIRGQIPDENKVIYTNENTSGNFNVIPNFSALELKSTTYFISMDIKRETGSLTFGKINDGNSDWTLVKAPLLSNNYNRYIYKKTYSENTSINKMLIQFIGEGSASIKNIKLEQGHKATPYSPYGMGSINDKIQTRNLFDKNSNFKTYNASVTPIDTGIKVENNDGGTYRSVWCEIGKDELLGKTLTIQTSISTYNSAIPRIIVVFNNETNQLIEQIKTITTSTEGTLVNIPNSFPENADRVSLIFYCSFGSATPIGSYVEYKNLQVELGSIATPYISHEEQDYSIFVQQPFRSNKDKTIRDKFVVKSDGKLYERHKFEQVDLSTLDFHPVNNNETSRTQGLFQAFIANIINNSSYTVTPSDTLSNKYQNGYVYQYISPGRNVVDKTMSRYLQYIYIQNSDFSGYTNEQVKEALAGTILQYPIETPLDLPCTEEQVEQLENLPSTYKDFTTINSEDETEAYLEVSGIYDLNKLITRVEVIESEV